MGVEHEYEPTPVAQLSPPVPTVEADGQAVPVPVGIGIGTLVVGHAEDRAEADADQRADTALGRLRRLSTDTATGADTEAHAHGPGCDHVRRSAAPSAAPSAAAGADPVVGREGGALDAGTSSAIEGRRGSGRPLDAEVRRKMETAFASDFGGVRIHDDQASATLNAKVAARAFTTGKDIFFGAGQYAPDTAGGERVLAHELAHTLQPPSGPVQRNPDAAMLKSHRNKPLPPTPGQAPATTDVSKLESHRNKPLPATPGQAPATTDVSKLESHRNKPLPATPGQAPATSDLSKLESHRNKPLPATPNHMAGDSASTKFDRSTRTKPTGELMAALNHARQQAAKQIEALQQVANQKKREIGVAERNALADKVKAELSTQKLHSPTLESLQQRFNDTIELEKGIRKILVEVLGIPAQEAYDMTYQEVWVQQADVDLWHVRPARETPSEQLRFKVLGARQKDTEELGKKSAEERDRALGTMLSKTVEKVYEDFVIETNRLMSGATPVERPIAEVMAEQTVWKKANDKARELRPRDPGIERLAIEAARKRVEKGNIGSPAAKPEKTAGESAEGVLGPLGTAATVVGGAATVTKQVLGKVDPVAEPAGEKKSIFEKIPGIGSLITASKKAGKNSETPAVPKDTVQKATEGIGEAKGTLEALMETAESIPAFIDAVIAAHRETSAEKVLAATKACADALQKLNKSATSTAKLAASIDPGVADSVKQVVPGLNIVDATMRIVANAIMIHTRAEHLSKAKDAIFDVRNNTAASNKVHVLTLPLLNVEAANGKHLEKAVFDEIIAVSNLVTAISSVATAGGMGIPAAVDAGLKVISTLHTAGHVIADDFLAKYSQQARKSALLALEGGAEDQGRHDPGMAVDSIVIMAREGDATAITLLKAHGLKQEDIDGSLSEARALVLENIGTNADPQRLYQTIKVKVGDSIKTIGTTKDKIKEKWAATGELAKTRNEIGKEDGDLTTERGIMWRLKMMAKGEVKFTRSVNKTDARKQTHQIPMVCWVGDIMLLKDASPREEHVFAAKLKQKSDAEIFAAAKDKDMDPTYQKFLLDVVAGRAAKSATP